VATETTAFDQAGISAKEVGMSLYGPYVIGVELSGILLMSGIVGAYHLGRQKKKVVHRFLEKAELEKAES
jgi:NADH-quinone oxidoreductase subunit J